MSHQPLRLTESVSAAESEAQPPMEYRKTRVQFMWPGRVKELVDELVGQQALPSVNEYALRVIVADLVARKVVDEATAKDLLRAAPTQPRKEKRAA